MLAVVDQVTAHERHNAQRTGTPAEELAGHIGKTVQFVRSAPFMHRLMIDELTQAGTEEPRTRACDMNVGLVGGYRELLREDGGKELVGTDPLFLYLAVLGASDFFSSAAPLIREMVPEGTDMTTLTADFEQFLITLVLDGVRKR